MTTGQAMHTPLNRRQLMQTLLGTSGVLAGMPAQAQANSGKLLFGFPRRGDGFVYASAVLKELQAKGSYQPSLGADLTYLPGNSGLVALRAAHAAAPDGATVLLCPSSQMTLLPQVQAMSKIDPSRDFVPVAALMSADVLFAVGPSTPSQVKTIKDYVAWVRDDPSQAGYGLPGRGTMPHFVATLMALSMEVVLKPMAYNGTGAILVDLIAGGVPAGFLGIGTGTTMKALQDAGVRPLAVTGSERWPGLPAVPTFSESGVGNVPPLETFGFFMSAAAPAAKVQALGDAIRQALRSPAVQAAQASTSQLALPKGADDYATLIAQERAAWNPLVKFHRFSGDA